MYSCVSCKFSLFTPIAELGVSVLGLYDDARFPGRCLLVLRDHYDDLVDVPESLTSSFMSDAKRAARAIQAAVSADRINYAILGNAVPHVHAHLIPRTWKNDPVPGKSPWNHPEAVTPLEADRKTRVILSILERLNDGLGIR